MAVPARGGTRLRAGHRHWCRCLLPWRLPLVPDGIDAQMDPVGSTCTHSVTDGSHQRVRSRWKLRPGTMSCCASGAACACRILLKPCAVSLLPLAGSPCTALHTAGVLHTAAPHCTEHLPAAASTQHTAH